MNRRQGLLWAGLLAAAIAACTARPPTTTTAPSPFSVLGAVVKSNQTVGGKANWGMPIVAVVPGTASAAMRDQFLSAANLCVSQIYPSVIAMGGSPADAQLQVLKLMTAAVGNERVTGLSVSLDSDPLTELGGLYVNFNASDKLKFGQAYRLAVTKSGSKQPITAGLILPKIASILEPQKAASVPMNADLTVRWAPQAGTGAYQLDLAATGPNASGDNAYSSPYLEGDSNQHRIPFKQFPAAGAASLYLTSLGGATAEDLAANRSNVQGASGVVLGISSSEQVITLVPSGSDSTGSH